MEYRFILNYLENHMSKRRYIHSINVSETAVALAEYYGGHIDKARLAGLIHDCAKDISIREQTIYAKKCGFPVDEVTYKILDLIHAPASVYLCRKIFGITDIEILSAVRYHTTGKPDMSLLEKIIFISDVIEPSRDFEDIEILRNMAYNNLDAALLHAIDSSISYIIKKRSLLHPDTIYARNYLINSLH